MTDTIIRTSKGEDRPYVSTARASAQNRELSWDARGVLWYLLSQPDDWKVIVEDLQQGCGRDKVRSILKELEDAGYLEVNKVRNAAGQFDFERLVHEIPVKAEPLTENTSVDELSLETPLTEKPEAANPPLHKDSNTNTETMSTLFASGFAAAFASMPKAETTVAIVETVETTQTIGINPTAATMQTVLPIETALIVHTVSPAPEPNLPISPFRQIIPLVADAGEPVVVEEGTKPEKVKKVRQPRQCDINRDALAKAFKIAPTSYGHLGNVGRLIFGTDKGKKDAWFECQLETPATLDEVKRFGPYAEKRAKDNSITIPTVPATIQRWFEDMRLEKKDDEQIEQVAEILRQPYEIIPIGIQRQREREAREAALQQSMAAAS